MHRSVLAYLVLILVLMQVPAKASDGGIPSSGSPGAPLSAAADRVGANPPRAQVDQKVHSLSPLFIENVGQFAEGARFQMWGGLGTVWLAEDGIWITVTEKDEGGRARPEQSEGMKDVREQSAFGLHPSSLILPPSRRVVHLKLSFVGANPHPRVEPLGRQETKVSYFIGADPKGWHADVPVWGGVRYVDLYPGIDLVMGRDAGEGMRDEKGLHPFPWRLVAREGADLGAVCLRIEGAEEVSFPSPHVEGSDTEGQDALHPSSFRLQPSLLLTTTLGEYSMPLPMLEGAGADSQDSQLAPGLEPQTGNPKPGLFEVTSPFAVAGLMRASEATATLADSPSDLLYATFLGGSGVDYGCSIAVDGQGQAYITGRTDSSDFPAAKGPGYDTSLNGWYDAYVVKLDASGTGLVYATFLGGSDYEDGYGIALDSEGQAYVTGCTASTDFPAASGLGYDTSHNGGSGDAYVVKLDASGTALVYATFLGGGSEDVGLGIAVDSAGQAYVTGDTDSTDFPAVSGPGYDTSYHGNYDAFVVKLNAGGMGLLYATFLGGGGAEEGDDIALDGAGQAYVTGQTCSADFPAANGPGYDTSHNGGQGDAYVVKLNASGMALVYATYLGGGSEDMGLGIAVDGEGQAYVTGNTDSADFPAASGPGYDTSYHGNYDAFVVKLSASGTSVVYATFLGGGDSEGGSSVAVDGARQTIITGQTRSADFPAVRGPGYDTTYNGICDTFVVELNASGTALAYATFLGGGGSDLSEGIATDGVGQVYVAGNTASTDFPAASGPGYDSSHNGGYVDAFVVKLQVATTTPIRDINISGPSRADPGSPCAFTANVTPLNATLPVTYTWQAADQGPIAHSGGLSDTVAFTWCCPGAKTITVVATNAAGTVVTSTHALSVTAPSFAPPGSRSAGGGFGTSQGWSSQERYPRYLADVDGDGRADVVGFFTSTVEVGLSTGAGFGPSTRWISAFTPAQGWRSQEEHPRFVADVNGDGKADIVGFSAFGVEVSLSTGRGFAPRTRWLADFGTFQRWIIQNLYPRVLADVNGDGKADVVGFFRDGVWVSLSAGDRFLPKTRWLADFGLLRGWVSFYTHPRLVADVNGDGKADVVGFVGDGAYVALSTGSGFQRKTCWIAPGAAQGWRGFNAYPRLLGDVNGDGQADIVSFSSGGAYVALSTGSRFCPATLGIAAYGSAQGWMGQNLHPRVVGDVNGDRKADIVGFWQSGAVVSLCQ